MATNDDSNVGEDVEMPMRWVMTMMIDDASGEGGEHWSLDYTALCGVHPPLLWCARFARAPEVRISSMKGSRSLVPEPFLSLLPEFPSSVSFETPSSHRPGPLQGGQFIEHGPAGRHP